MHLPPLRLKKHEEKRVKQGHLWVYSNEIDTQTSPLKMFSAGQPVEIHDACGQLIGKGYINPNTLLCARVLTFNAAENIDQIFFEKRIQQALNLREHYFPGPYYRLIYGEGDFLPGLIVDRFGDILSVQITTAGIELLKDTIINALMAIIKPKAIVLRNDHSMRETEGLTSYVETVYGSIDGACEIIENETRFLIPVSEGQKTGWFYDHGDNRRRMIPFIKNKRVLDVFSYLGSWSIQALKHGAREAWALDASVSALEICQQNARLNNVENQFHTVQGDAFQQLKNLYQNNERFDVVLLDPPAFIKRRKDKKEGLIGYQRINELAMKLLHSEGILVTSSCSMHLETQELVDCINRASSHQHRFTQIIARGHQNVDHPIHPMIPETAYLKTLYCRSLK